MLVESFVAADGFQQRKRLLPARPDANSERIQKEKVERLFNFYSSVRSEGEGRVSDLAARRSRSVAACRSRSTCRPRGPGCGWQARGSARFNNI
jgi:hypothetical protein